MPSARAGRPTAAHGMQTSTTSAVLPLILQAYPEAERAWYLPLVSGPKVIGLTGGIAAGKSAVARLLRERGAAVVDADELARRVVAPGEPALAEIVQRFGSEVLS